MYTHLNLEEREAIRVGLAIGQSKRAIARTLGRSHTSIIREIKRNSTRQSPDKLKPSTYIACKADSKAQKRASDQRKSAPLKCPFIYVYVRKWLRKRRTPEQIAGRLSLEYPQYSIHHETIYRYIYSKPVKSRYKLWRYLTLRRPKRRAQTGRSVRRIKGTIPNAISIDQRPKYIEDRVECGHWESDLMEGTRITKDAVSATVERKTRYTILTKVANKTAVEKTNALLNGLSPLPQQLIKSLTVDNGKENTQHQLWSTHFDAPTYYCHAYHSWEKGSVENSIGRIRRFIPKGTPLGTVTDEQIQLLQDWLNHTPRKCLGWRTPHEALQEELTQTAH